MISSISYNYKQFVVPFMLQMKITNSLKMNSNNMSQSGEHTGLFEQWYHIWYQTGIGSTFVV